MILGIIFLSIMVLFAFSASYSASETAIFSMPLSSRIKLEENEKVKNLFKNQDIVLASILTGNLIVNVMISSLGTLFLIYLSEIYNLPKDLTFPIGAVAIVGLLLVFGEITPKIFAVRNSQKVFKLTFLLTYFSTLFLKPITKPLGFLTRKIFKPKDVFPTESDIHAMVNIARKLHVIKNNEEEIMENLLYLGKMTASEVMTPRVKIIAFEGGLYIKDVISSIKKTKKSRYPIYHKSIDNIIGIIYTKDIIINEKNKRLKEIARTPLFVPETKKLIELLEEFRKGELHIAIVVDEFGGTSGLVTLEDILEVIFGEISDEYDRTPEEPYRKISKDTYIFEGDVDMLTVKKVFHEVFDNVESERLSEFILEKLGKIPKEGESFIHNGTEVKVIHMKNRAINKVIIRKL